METVVQEQKNSSVRNFFWEFWVKCHLAMDTQSPPINSDHFRIVIHSVVVVVVYADDDGDDGDDDDDDNDDDDEIVISTY